MRRTEKLTEWLKELRSGRHMQGLSVLERIESHDVYSYCCLGVARKFVFGRSCADDVDLKVNELDELSMSTDDQAVCIRMNDTLRLTFHEIADVVEEAAVQEGEVENALLRWIARTSFEKLQTRPMIIEWLHYRLAQQLYRGELNDD